jgi:hypothetical protein
MLRPVHADAVIIQTFTVGEAPYLAPGGQIPDDVLLHRLVCRNLPFPQELTCRYRNGFFEISADPAKCLRLREAIKSHVALIGQTCEKNDDEVIASLRRLLSFNPFFERARIDLSQMLVEGGQADEALDELVEGLRIDPDNPAYYASASFLLTRTEAMRTVAERYASKAIELNTCGALADYVLGYIALDNDDAARAVRHFDRMLELEPNACIAHYGKGQALGRMGRFKNAAAEFEKFFMAARGATLAREFVETSQGMYLECCSHLEKRTREAREKAAKREMARLEAELGWCVELRENDPGEASNTSTPTIVWRNHIPPGTVIIQGPRSVLDRPDFVLRNLLEIRIETLAHRQNKSCPRPTLRQQAAAIAVTCGESQICLPDECDLKEREEFFASQRDLCATVIFEPVNWLIDTRILKDWPLFKWLRLLTFHDAVQLQLQACGDEAFGELMAPSARTALMAMLGAGALILADLSNGALDLTEVCRRLPVWSRCLHIRDHWKNRVERKFKPGEEAALIDEIATIAGFITDRKILTQGRLF